MSRGSWWCAGALVLLALLFPAASLTITAKDGAGDKKAEIRSLQLK
jgi:hypothetical protein